MYDAGFNSAGVHIYEMRHLFQCNDIIDWSPITFASYYISLTSILSSEKGMMLRYLDSSGQQQTLSVDYTGFCSVLE